MYSYAVDETPFPSRVAPKMNPRENQCCVIARRGLKNGVNKGADILMHARSFEAGELQRSRCCACPRVWEVCRVFAFLKNNILLMKSPQSLPDALEAVCSYE